MIAKFVFRSIAALLISIGLTGGSIAFAQDDTPPTATPIATATSRRVLSEQTISGGSFVLHANETIEGDLVVLGGSATLEAGARVEGDVNIAGGSVDIAGTVTGDVNVLGGSIKLRTGSVVEGGTQIVGGSIDREDGAVVQQDDSKNAALKIDPPAGRFDIGKQISREITAEMARANAADRQTNENQDWQSAWAIISGILFVASLVLMVLVSVSVVTLVPAKTHLMLATARSEWLVSGGIGLLSIIALSILIALFTLTLCLIPLAGVLGLALIAGSLIGIAVIAQYVGERLMLGLGKHGWAAPKTAAIGALAIALVGAIPVINILIYLMLTSIGLGALVLTRFGTRPYPYLTQLPSMPD